jgi:hypothetical protein
MKLLGWFLALGAAAVGACAPDMGPRVCSAGATQACLCADGRMGVQSCDESGARWGVCGCIVGPMPMSDAGSDATPCSGSLCAGQCVDTSNSNVHCGACGRACSGGQVCMQGMCALTCGNGESICSQSCVNTRVDRGHCGGCGRACASSEDCVAGACVARCPAGQSSCSGSCANLQTDARNCGACGAVCAANQRCMTGSCVAAMSPVRVDWQFPGLWQWMGATDTWLPNYVTHLMGVRPPVSHEVELELACASVTNGGSTAQRVDIELRIPAFASPVMQSAMVAAGATTRICPTPAFSMALRSLRAEQPGALELYARLPDGSEVSRAMRSFTATASNAVLWGNVASPEAMGTLATVFVTPNDPALLGLRPAVEARSVFPGGFGGGAPYDRPQYNRMLALTAGAWQWESTFLRAGARMTWRVVSVSGGTPADIDVYAFTLDQFTAWRDRGGTAAISVARDQLSGATGSFVAPTDGAYVLVLFNTDTAVARSVSWTRANTGYDVARDALLAIFNELRARRITYTNLSSSYFTGWQNIRRPAESLSMRTANCIDGALLFASLIESAGMHPYLFLPPGHAYVGVRMGPAADDFVLPIETTLVGGARSADDAISCALGGDGCASNLAMPRYVIDVTAARRAGVRPIPTS